MLSPHEIAALMLVDDEADQAEISGTDLEALVGRKLVTDETLSSGRRQLHLTVDGQMILHAMVRIR
jgi:hypothetical protein